MENIFKTLERVRNFGGSIYNSFVGRGLETDKSIVAALTLGIAVLAPINLAHSSTLGEQICMQQAFDEDGSPGTGGSLNCTANDVSLADAKAEFVGGQCTPGGVGETVTIRLLGTINQNAGDRYDIGFYFADMVGGATAEDAMKPEMNAAAVGNSCTIAILDPGDVTFPNSIENQIASGDGLDQCGETSSGIPSVVDYNFGEVEVSCDDIDLSTGVVDVEYCAAWRNATSDQTCSIIPDVAGNIFPPAPDNKAKCTCDTTKVTVGGITITKRAIGPDGNFTTDGPFNITASSDNGDIPFEINGNESEIFFLPPGEYVLSEDLPPDVSEYMHTSWTCVDEIGNEEFTENISIGVTLVGAQQNDCTVVNTIPPDPELSITKVLTSGANPASEDDVLSYTVTATNTGNVVLTNVVVSDPDLTNDSQNTCASVAIGETCVLTGSYTITLADVTAGEFMNTATANSAETDEVEASVTVPVNGDPELSITKSADPLTVDTLGQLVTYTYVVTNIGNVSLDGPATVSDDKIVSPNTVVCEMLSDGVLDPMESVNCSATYAATQADFDVGVIRNTAFATVDEVPSPPVEELVTAILPEPPVDDPFPTRTIGYWKTHPDAVNAVLANGGFEICGNPVATFCDAYNLLNLPGGGANNYLRQATAAQLNCNAESGGKDWNCPAEIQTSINNCQISDASYLDRYNNGAGEFGDGIGVESVDGLLQPDGHGRANRRAGKACARLRPNTGALQ